MGLRAPMLLLASAGLSVPRDSGPIFRGFPRTHFSLAKGRKGQSLIQAAGSREFEANSVKGVFGDHHHGLSKRGRGFGAEARRHPVLLGDGGLRG